MKEEQAVFAVFDPDISYACRLMEFIKDRRMVPMEVVVFSTAEILKEAAAERKIRILLASEDAAGILPDLPAETVILLTEEKKVLPDTEFPAVFKYQAADDLMRKVLDLCGEQGSFHDVKKSRENRLKIVGIYSPVGRTRKTSFALTLGQILARENAVLYLNMESFAGFEQIFEETYERTLSDLIYFSRQKRTDFQNKLRGMVYSIQNLDYVPPVLSPGDIQEIKGEEWLGLFRKIEEQSDYEILILDLGDGVQGLFSVLSACSHILVPVRGDPLSGAKTEQFDRTCRMAGCGESGAEIQKVKLPFFHVNKSGKAYFQDLVWSELGDFIRQEILQMF